MRIKQLLATSAAALLLAAGCGSDSGEPTASADTQDAPESSESSTDSASETTDPWQSAESESLSDETITLNDEQLRITQAGSLTLTGDSAASVVVNTDGDVHLILDGVNIVSETGAAIVVEQADNVFIELAEGSENYLEDAASRSDAEINGTIYSDTDLTISGTGSVAVKANYEDGIVAKDDLEILSGTIVIDALDEGIRGRDSISISDGEISITAGGDGLKTTNETDLDRGEIYISGGSLILDVVDDAIKAATTITIDGGTIDILDALEGLEAVNITINDGDITVNAQDDGVNAVAGEIAMDVFITVNRGVIDVTVASGDTDAFDSNGSITISGGDITVTAPTSSFDYNGTAEMTGGTLVVNGEEVSSIPENQRRGR